MKQAGLGIRNPVDCACALFEASENVCEEVVESLITGMELSLAQHKKKVRGASSRARNYRIADEVAALERRGEARGTIKKWRLKRAGLAGIWLSCVPHRLNGTEISAEEFRDNLRLRYNLAPLAMPDRCDGCGARMTVEHALSCKVGGLVHIRHDDVAQEFGHLCGLAYKPTRVS